MGARGTKTSKGKRSKKSGTSDHNTKADQDKFYSIDVVLQQKIKLHQEPVIFGCAIINKLLLFVDCSDQNKRIIIHDLVSNESRNISLAKDPRGITVIDNDIVAVSFPRNHSIDIISIETGIVKKTINFQEECWGLSFDNGLLYVVIFKKRIDVLTLKGKTKRCFALPTLTPLFIKVSNDKMYCTDQRELFCCDSHNGVILWTFKNDIIELLTGVTIDENGCIYVAGNASHNVIVVTPDGKNYKEILTKHNGLDTPMAINFDILSSCCLVCNQLNGEVFFFRIDI